MPNRTIPRIKVLVPVDYSDCSRNAVRFAIKISQRIPSEIHLFHGYYSPGLDLIEFAGSKHAKMEIEAELVKKLESEENRKMDAFIVGFSREMDAAILEKTPISYELKLGHADHAILNKIESFSPDMVVMGSRSMSDREKAFLGSITEEVISKAKVPVLAVPANYSFVGIENLDNIAYITKFDETDFISIKKLIKLTSTIIEKIYCIHISSPPIRDWDRVKVTGLKEYFKTTYGQVNVETAIIESKNLLSDLDDFIAKNQIKALAITYHKKSLISNLFKPSLTKKIFYHSMVPLLVFHA